jgi:hypothetical protein
MPTTAQLKQAVKLSEKLDALNAELASILSGSSGSGKAPKVKPDGRKKKRTMSPEAKEKIAVAQRKRWAKQKKAQKAA